MCIRDRRISVSKSDSEAIGGENEARAKVADSDATRREKEAEALKRATAAENIAKARAEQESFDAQRAAEEARAHFEQAKLEADVIVKLSLIHIFVTHDGKDASKCAAVKPALLPKVITNRLNGDIRGLPLRSPFWKDPLKARPAQLQPTQRRI